ncbi:uncharacterized protein LOC126835198 [Adelges cooleyi]|uniref:uncharacterized protein LOC126835198 n=1 Tax=Adelges cooleyi TaxID=133065 RepID=UPI00218023D0|nr:uncharacterized protein LOC126835198 [Adelges cooleyi]
MFVTDIPVPETQNFDGFREVLRGLGKKRRKFTEIALKNILNRTINYGKPENVTNHLNERSRLGSDPLEYRIIRALAGPEEDISIPWMCHMIALYLCIKKPISYTTNIQLNSNGTCTLSDDITFETYGKIEGQWCQVIGNEVRPLKELL